MTESISGGLQRVGAQEGVNLVSGPPLAERLAPIAAAAMQAINASGVIISWASVGGRWSHVGAGSFTGYVPEAEPPWLEVCRPGELYAVPAMSNLDLPAGFPPGLTAIALRGVGGAVCGTFSTFDRNPSTRSEQLSVLRDYAGWVETELRAEALYESQAQLAEALSRSRELALQDPLTRLWNRQAIYNLLNTELLRAERDRNALSVVFADLDGFDRIIDRYGSRVADQVLTGTAQVLCDAVRPYDVLGRFGGEEFLMLLPGCPGDVIANVAERMRTAISGRVIESDAGPVAVTASFGVAASDAADQATPRGLLHAADLAMQRARSSGRDRVEVATDADYSALSHAADGDA